MVDLFNLNLAKTRTINALVSEGFLSREDADYFLDNYLIIETKKSWFTRQWGRIFEGRKDDGSYYDIVKIIGDEANRFNGEDCMEPDANGEEESISQLEFKLTQAEKAENFELASKIKRKIQSLKK